MLRIILGPAGSGKSRLLYDNISSLAQKGEQSLLIVPDSMSHLAERRLLLHCGNKVSRCARVCTLSRLAGDMLKSAGDTTRYLDDGGRVLCMYRAIRSLRGRLRYFDDRIERAALVSSMLDTVNEFIFSGTAEDHPALSSPDLSAKMDDIAQIYRAYMDICRAGSLDPAQMLDRAREKAQNSPQLRGVHLFFDDFSAYSEQKLRFIEALRENCESSTFAILTNGDRVTFCDAHKMADRLIGSAQSRGEPVEQTVLPHRREGRSLPLNALEHLFDAHKTPCTCAPGDSVQLFSARDEKEECELAAATVRQLTVQKGARLRDIAICCGSEESYSGLMEGAFIRYGIPCFFSRREEVLKKPALAAALGPLNCISDGMRLEQVLSYLRCGLLSESDGELCSLENYALLWGISGKAWFEPFYKPTCGFETPYPDESERLEQLESLRLRLMTPLLDLKEQTSGRHSGEELVQVFCRHLEASDLRGKFEERIRQLEKSGRYQQAQEYSQLYDILLASLSQLSAVCGGLDMDVGEFSKLLKLTLSRYDVSSIPTSLDSVTFGPFSRLSPFGVKHLIVLGARAGALPPDAPSGSIIGESERDALEKAGIRLPRAEDKALSQQSDVYRAFNAPDLSLTVIYPRTGADGSTCQKSFVVSYMQKLLPKLTEESADSRLRKLRLTAPATAFELACSAGTEGAQPEAQAAFDWLSRDTQTAQKLTQVRAFALRQKSSIPPDTLKKLYGGCLSVSASAIEKFYTCRFAYFCQFGLRARERREASLGALEVGTMVHSIVENAVRALSDGTESDVRAAAEKYTREYAAALRGADTPRMQALIAQIRDNAAVVVQDVWDEIEHSDFKPRYFELNFSRKGDIAPYTWETNGLEFALRGKIDRVDTCGDKLKVVDYKTGSKKYSLSDILRGKNLQPFIYMLMLKKAQLGENCAALFLPAKAEYIDSDEALDDGRIAKKRTESVRRLGLVRGERDILESLEHGAGSGKARWLPVSLRRDGSLDPKKSSIALKDQMDRIIAYTEEKLTEFSRLVSSGEVDISPCGEDACKYCAFYSACFAEDIPECAGGLDTNSTETVLAVINGEEGQSNGEV
ncbi:MAG: PD-(D/E)XK nuclease family protein [Clostridia bacterium]|nr:PD-(D/E)XK nuclease family protein [Clostridia bacterium]